MDLFPEITRKVETARFGPFVFQLGIDQSQTVMPLQRVLDAQERFKRSPLSQVASRLEPEILVSSVFGTNSIEAGKLTEEETAAALELAPEQVENIEQRRVVNIQKTYDLAIKTASHDWRLTVDFIRAIHAAITDGIPHEDNQPGLFRNNQRGLETYVGDAVHGGRYKPPQYNGDIELLLTSLVSWHDELTASNIPPLLRAPLVHFYFELIHPFYDGNGRVGRILEASVLHAAGFRYAPFAMARYYLHRIDAYFTLFNTCRKSGEKGQVFANAPFVLFHLEGMLTSINRLHDRVNDIINIILFENHLKHLWDSNGINARQYAIVSQVLGWGKPLPIAELQRAPWYEALYEKRGHKTRQRDLRKLIDLALLRIDEKNGLWPVFVKE